MISIENLLTWLIALQTTYLENKQYLTDLDAAIGDADHGINMERGFTAVKQKIEATDHNDVGSLLKITAMTLISTVGGASGPLYGTFFLRASTACARKTTLTNAELVNMFDVGLQGVVQRGKARLADKTMIDALTPALEAMTQALENGASLTNILQAGTDAAEHGMQQTIPMLAKKGRASYLGERSIGHQDPGATSSYLMLKTALDVWGNEET
ncbi:dihydroxyacetone kinase subunit DhaL [Anaerolineales bacterium HSG24]|nr:dihydroxyacetone kinase subunit DhaL [Anaerolineales bacterium HSG24]